MSRRSMVHAVLAAASLLGLSMAGEAGAQEAFSIDVNSLSRRACFGQPTCPVDEADVSALGSTLTREIEQWRHRVRRERWQLGQ